MAEEIYRYLIGDSFGNPSSVHHLGLQVRKKVTEAREKVAQALGADAGEIRERAISCMKRMLEIT